MTLPGFPNSTSDNWRPTSRATSEYNCLSWSVHRSDVFMWPDERKQFSWPDSMTRSDTVDALRSFFEAIGFSCCDTHNLEVGSEKIAVYAIGATPEHIARQVSSSGKWTSKLGEGIDIEHDTLAVLEGGRYGTVCLVMRRVWNGPPVIPPLNPGPPRLITPGGMPLLP